MKKILFALILIVNFAFGDTADQASVTGNQASIADLKEAVYKLILLNDKHRTVKQKVIYKPLPLKKSYLDKYIKAYVRKNKRYLPSR